MSVWGQMNLHDPATLMCEALGSFHDMTVVLIVGVMTFVAGIFLGLGQKNSFIDKTLSSHHMLELIWTMVPAIILIAVAIPSLTLLFMMEDSSNAHIIVKVTGQQWYWNYEFSLFDSLSEFSIESFMVPEKNGKDSLFRNLDVTESLYLPLGVPVRLFVTSADVLHAWTVPSLGVKTDACPGRLNEVILSAIRPGQYFGQCSEICGANHSFMPISVKVIKMNEFMSKVSNLMA